MASVCTRPIAAIDADLHACRAGSRDAWQELGVVRGRQAELAQLEAELLVTIETRSMRVDRLLDERLHAAAGSGGTPGHVTAGGR